MINVKTNNTTSIVTVSTVHPGPNGGAIFTGQDNSGKWFRVVANHDRLSRPPIKGETWRIVGELKYHPVYRMQMHLESGSLVNPTGNLLIRFLNNHPNFRGIGIGAGKIAKLHKVFGDNLRQILQNGDEAALTQILTQETAQKLISAWHIDSQESAVIAFLDEHKIDARLARKIIQYWGREAVDKLRENPYRLLILTTWQTADRLARQVGIGLHDKCRLIAAVEAWMYKSMDEYKNTSTTELNLKNGIRHFIGKGDDKTLEQAIEYALQEHAIVGDPANGYQPLGCAVMEKFIAERFRLMLLNNCPVQLDLFGFQNKNALVDTQIRSFEERENITLNPEQRHAVHMATTSSLSVLRGGAGVGKTTVLKVIYSAVEAMRCQVFQVALAGRAAQRMREATGQDAYTIIGFLNLLQNNQIIIKAGDLIVVDEASMVDLLLMYRLVRSLPVDARLLFVGDPHQLPPIGPGLVFHVLTESKSVTGTELTQIHRQAASTGIPQTANNIRDGIIPNLARYIGLGTGVSFVECEAKSIANRLVAIVNDLGGFAETQILGVIKAGEAGITNINDTFHKIMTGDKPQLEHWDLAESDPIIFTVNDYERELFNGSLGFIEKTITHSLDFNESENAATRARANFDGRIVDLTDEDIGNIDLAYAITVHKMQGSQFKRIVIPITESRLLDRTLIYTAVTRSVEQVVFVGDRRAFERAVVAPPSSSLRSVGFSV